MSATATRSETNGKVTAPTVRLASVKELKPAPWNPKARSEDTRTRRLRASIEDIGLLYPILTDETGRIVDGHRRVAVFKKMGLAHIPAITVSSEFEHTYGSVQLNQEKLSGNDLLGVYLSNPRALLGSQRRKIERIEESCGRDAVTTLYRGGFSHGLFDLAMRVVAYLDAKLEPAQILYWLARHKMGGVIKRAIDDGIAYAKVRRAIEEDRPLKVKLTAED